MRRNIQGGAKMPTIKVLRNGQLTLPARFRKVLELKQGDLLNAELEDNKIVLKPVTTVEREKMKEGAKKRFFALVDRVRERNKNLNPEEIRKIIDRAIEEVRKESRT